MLELIFLAAVIVLGIAAWRQNDRMHRIEGELNAIRADYLSRTRSTRPVSEAEGAEVGATAAASPASVADMVAQGTVPETAVAPGDTLQAEPAAAEARERAKQEAMAKAIAMLDAEEREKLATTPPAGEPAAPQPAGQTPRSREIETALGTRWAVWVGGLALAFGGVFLIRYTIEAGIFGPIARLTLAAIFGLVLVGGGEFLRRTGFKMPVEGLQNAYIPAILTAVGAFMLFGTVYAAHGVYGYVGPGVAFALLGVIAVGTVAAALVHGQALGAIGLLGAFATPALVASSAPNFWALFGYLAIVLAAAAWIARMRDWAFLMSGALVGAGVWAVLHLVSATTLLPDGTTTEPDFIVALFIQAVILGSLALIWLGRREESHAGIDAPSVVAAILSGLAAVILFVNIPLAPFGGAIRGAVLVAALLGVAAWRGRALPLLHAAGIVTVLAFVRTALTGTFNLNILGENITLDGAPYMPRAEDMAWIGIVLGVLFLAVGLWRAWSLVKVTPRAALWSAWAAAAPIAIVACVWFSFGNPDVDWRYAIEAAALAVVLMAGAEWIARAEQPPLSGGRAVSFALVGAGFALLLFLHAGFTAAWTTVLLGAAAVLPVLATRLRSYPVLGWLAVGSAVAVLLRAAVDPTIVGPFALSTTPVFNWLLPGYGVSALAFAFAAWQLGRTTNVRPRLVMEAAAAIFALLTVAMLVRHAMNGGVIDSSVPTLAEQAIYTLIALGFGAILIALDLRSPSPVLRVGSLIAGVVSMALVVIQHFLLLNPLFTDESTGTIAVFDLIFLGYLLPAIAAGGLAWYARGKRPKWYSASLALIGAMLLFSYATLSVRRAFHGEFIALWRDIGQVENYTYSALWLMLGVVLLATGIFLRSYVLRVASAVLIVVAVAKVFLIDMSELEGALRALSFIGLGAVLIGIGLFYQRMLTRSAAGQSGHEVSG
jgi:uncharacterized membrane protein